MSISCESKFTLCNANQAVRDRIDKFFESGEDVDGGGKITGNEGFSAKLIFGSFWFPDVIVIDSNYHQACGDVHDFIKELEDLQRDLVYTEKFCIDTEPESTISLIKGGDLIERIDGEDPEVTMINKALKIA